MFHPPTPDEIDIYWRRRRRFFIFSNIVSCLNGMFVGLILYLLYQRYIGG